MTITLKSNPDGVSGAIQVNGVDAVTVDKTGIIQGAPFSFRNKIINGDMNIAQRGTSFAAIANGTYSLDRWAVVNTTTAVATVTQAADAPSDNEFQSSLRYAVITADASMASGDAAFIGQRIEGFNVRDLIGRTFTISFRVRSSKTGVHCVVLRNSGTDRCYVAEYTINAANTWEQKSITVSGGLITAGTWNWTNGLGLYVEWIMACGSTYQTTAGAWQTGNFLATANQVNVLDTVGNIFAITGVQLEAGSIATPFEHRPIGTELALCQRYYYAAGVYQWLSRPTDADPNLKGTYKLAQTMRANPTVTNTASSAVTLETATTDYITWTRGASGVAQIYTFTASAEL